MGRRIRQAGTRAAQVLVPQRGKQHEPDRLAGRGRGDCIHERGQVGLELLGGKLGAVAGRIRVEVGVTGAVGEFL